MQLHATKQLNTLRYLLYPLSFDGELHQPPRESFLIESTESTKLKMAKIKALARPVPLKLMMPSTNT